MARHRKPTLKLRIPSESAVRREPAELRIIGGTMRGRKLLYSGDPRTRPMKDRVREAVFNLVGPEVAGKHAIDLFAGTGALGLEALSRGAARATFIEQHFPTAALIRQNAAQLGVADRCDVLPANTFIWARRPTAGDDRPWVVFCSPPFAFYSDRQAEMLALVEGLLERAPPGSTFVIEADEKFDSALLPEAEAWDIREYPPAVVAVYRKAMRPMPPGT
ncbi:MAG: RsmD family RNA methyltransferase [Planctomycetia bacterium]|nr:RsmD family RNA methyltransferase [Planctomycetia bacterium]